MLQDRVPNIATLRFLFSAAFGLTVGQVRRLWPVFPQAEQILTCSILRFRLIFRSGCRTGHVRELCPTVPQLPHTRRPSFRGVSSRFSLRVAPFGFPIGHVRELCPLSPQILQERVNRFFSRTIRRLAALGFTSGQVLTLCPASPQDVQTRPALATQSLSLFDLWCY